MQIYKNRNFVTPFCRIASFHEIGYCAKMSGRRRNWYVFRFHNEKLHLFQFSFFIFWDQPQFYGETKEFFLKELEIFLVSKHDISGADGRISMIFSQTADNFFSRFKDKIDSLGNFQNFERKFEIVIFSPKKTAKLGKIANFWPNPKKWISIRNQRPKIS